MTPEREKEFNTLFGMFKTEGWELFQKELQAKWNELRSTFADQDPEKWKELKGYIYGIGFSLTFEDQIKSIYDNQKQAEKDDDAA